jgi:hypothetical protein
MAFFHCSVKVISRSIEGGAGNAVAAAAYRSGTRMTCKRTGQVFNYTRKKEVTHRAILAPEGSPSWALDRNTLFNEVELEQRVNSQLLREVEVALPIQLSHDEQVALLHNYVNKEFIPLSMVADISLHSKPGNPHAHILLTLRDLDNAHDDAPTWSRFGIKRRDWNSKAYIHKWREAWATACNAALEQAGSSERIDHRSNKARGIDAPPTVHVGRRTPWNTQQHHERLDYNASIRAWAQTNAELEKINFSIREIDSQLIDLTTSIAQALAERDGRQAANSPTQPTPSAIWTPAGEQAIKPVTAASLLMQAQRKQSTRRNPALNPDDCISPKETPNVQIITSSTR